MFNVSFSTLDSWRECPAKAGFRRLDRDRILDNSTAQQKRGIAFHEKILQVGANIEGHKLLFAELKIKLDFYNEVGITGSVDGVYAGGLIDVKTTRPKNCIPSKLAAYMDSDQLRMYAYALETQHGLRVDKVGILLVGLDDDGKEVRRLYAERHIIPSYETYHWEEDLLTCAKYFENSEPEEWEARPNKFCDWCAAQSFCNGRRLNCGAVAQAIENEKSRQNSRNIGAVTAAILGIKKA